MLAQNVTSNILGGLPEIPVSSRVSDDFNNGRVCLVIYARVTFNDIFDTRHESKFCHWFAIARVEREVSRLIGACVQYNGIDKN